MSAWQLPHDGQQQQGEHVGPQWHPNDIQEWDFARLGQGDDIWDSYSFDDLAPADYSSPQTTSSNAVNPNAYMTLFPPPHDFFARPRESTPLVPQREANAAAPGVAARADLRPTGGNHTSETANINQQGRFGYIVDHLFDLPSPSVSEFSFVTLGESSSSGSDEQDMPPATRSAAARRSSLVDLTSGALSHDTADSPSRRAAKRRADETAGGPSKRRMKETVSAEDVEEIDLSNEASSAEEMLKRKQQEEAIRAQQAAQKDQEPQRIGQRQCIICMENYTNATVTSCGHFFCHECLSQALAAGERNSERGIGSCPVCRKSLSRKKKNEIIPIAFMKKEQFAKNQAARTDILV